MSQKDMLWAEFQQIRAKVRDLRDYAAWAARKRDEAATPEDYVFYSKDCNNTLKQQSDCAYRETELHFQLLNCVEKSE